MFIGLCSISDYAELFVISNIVGYCLMLTNGVQGHPHIRALVVTKQDVRRHVVRRFVLGLTEAVVLVPRHFIALLQMNRSILKEREEFD